MKAEKLTQIPALLRSPVKAALSPQVLAKPNTFKDGLGLLRRGPGRPRKPK